jgi:hypothetical protein
MFKTDGVGNKKKILGLYTNLLPCEGGKVEARGHSQ